MKKEKKKKKEVCNDHVTVARGRGVANGHMTVGGQEGQGGRGRGGKGGGKRGPGWGEEERGASQARHSGLFGLVIVGPSGPPPWAHQARHSGPAILGPPEPSPRPVQYKARGLVVGLKKLNSGPVRPVDWSTGL